MAADAELTQIESDELHAYREVMAIEDRLQEAMDAYRTDQKKWREMLNLARKRLADARAALRAGAWKQPTLGV